MNWFTFSAPDVARSFLSVLLEGVPFLLLGSLISGLVDVFVSSERLAKLLPKGRLRVVPGAGADWPHERPNELAELVTRFVR